LPLPAVGGLSVGGSSVCESLCHVLLSLYLVAVIIRLSYN
jgi:hypothetical protein